jgi:DnaJ-class molecular chaperone
MEFEKKVCPDCNGSGVYQEYDEYDRYTVHSCATCDGSGEIARQSATSEEVNESLCKLCANVGCYYNERNLMMLECTEYIPPKGEQ